MAYTPELEEQYEEERNWKAESERMLNMIGWGDEEDEESTVPPLVDQPERDSESSVSSCDETTTEEEEDDLPEWIREGRARATCSAIVEFDYNLFGLTENENKEEVLECRKISKQSCTQGQFRWNGIEIPKERQNENEIPIPGQNVVIF